MYAAGGPSATSMTYGFLCICGSAGIKDNPAQSPWSSRSVRRTLAWAGSGGVAGALLLKYPDEPPADEVSL